jgi:hypothetical protein
MNLLLFFFGFLIDFVGWVTWILAERQVGRFLFGGGFKLRSFGGTRNLGGTGCGGPVAMGVHTSEVMRLCTAAATMGWSTKCSGSPDNDSVSEDSDRSEDTRRSLASKTFTSWQRNEGKETDNKRRIQED